MPGRSEPAQTVGRRLALIESNFLVPWSTKDLPRGRNRPGWKREFTRKLETTARELSGVTESQIAETIRAYRAEKKRLPEITVARSQRSSWRSDRQPVLVSGYFVKIVN
jgi:hypothetical protein